MNKIQAWFEKHVVPLAAKIGKQRHLIAIQNALLLSLPMMMIGSYALILAYPPVDYSTFAESSVWYSVFKVWADFATAASVPLNLLFDVTLGCLSVFIAIGVAYFLSKHYKLQSFIPITIVFASFLILNSERLDGAYASSYFGGEGLFAAMVLSILICEFYRWLIEKEVGKIKLPDSVPDAISASFESLVPAIIILSVVTVFGHVLRGLDTSLPVLILSMFRPIIRTVDSVLGAAFVTLITQILWWFGIHDSAVGAIIGPIRDANLVANATAYAAGTSLTNLPYIFTSSFYFTFGTIGGSGATLALVFLLLKSKSAQLRTVGKIGLAPSLFNINEPILFGMPIILNPILLIPFLSAQTLNVIITYLCMAGGIINKTMVDPGWNMFSPVGALIATLDVKAVVLLLLLVVMDALIYYPFFKIYEKRLIEEDLENSATEAA